MLNGIKMSWFMFWSYLWLFSCYFPNNNWNYMRKCFIEQSMSWNQRLPYQLKKLKANGFVSNIHKKLKCNDI